MDTQTVLNTILGGFLALLGITWKAQDKRIENLEDECNEQGKSIVRLDAQHGDVLRRLSSIEDTQQRGFSEIRDMLNRVLEER